MARVELKEEEHSASYSREAGKELRINVFNDDGALSQHFVICDKWPRNGRHGAQSLQTAVRVLQKLAAQDWRGAALRDLWDDGSNGGVPLIWFSLLEIPGSLTKSVDLHWTVHLTDNFANVCSLPNGRGFATWAHALTASDSWGRDTVVYTKLPDDAPLLFRLELAVHGDSPNRMYLCADKHAIDIAAIAKWMLARAVEWQPDCVKPPLTWLVLSRATDIARIYMLSPAFIQALAVRGVDKNDLMSMYSPLRADPRTVEAALDVGVRNIGVGEAVWELVSVPAAARAGLLKMDVYGSLDATPQLHQRKYNTHYIEELRWTYGHMLEAMYYELKARRAQKYSVGFEWDWGAEPDKAKATEMTQLTATMDYVRDVRVVHVAESR